MTLNLTPEQAQQLLSLIDLAVRNGGLNVAAVALPLAQIIQDAAQQETPQ